MEMDNKTVAGIFIIVLAFIGLIVYLSTLSRGSTSTPDPKKEG
jgi:hypothetical protein